jgi:hypothetical protein
MPLKLMRLPPNKIRKKETEDSPTNTNGILMKPRKFGASDLKLQELTFLLIRLKPFNILTKLRILAKLLSNGLLKKQS